MKKEKTGQEHTSNNEISNSLIPCLEVIGVFLFVIGVLGIGIGLSYYDSKITLIEEEILILEESLATILDDVRAYDRNEINGMAFWNTIHIIQSLPNNETNKAIIDKKTKKMLELKRGSLFYLRLALSLPTTEMDRLKWKSLDFDELDDEKIRLHSLVVGKMNDLETIKAIKNNDKRKIKKQKTRLLYLFLSLQILGIILLESGRLSKNFNIVFSKRK